MKPRACFFRITKMFFSDLMKNFQKWSVLFFCPCDHWGVSPTWSPLPSRRTKLFYTILGSILLALLGLIAGIWSEKFDNMSGITNFIITPLTFLSGTFYTIDRLPEPFFTISLFNPFYYIIDGFRSAFQSNINHDLVYGITYISVLNLILYLLSYYILKKGWMLKP